MQSRATIQSAKVGGSEHGRESVLTLTLDVRLPTPVEVRTINDWAGSELDWQTRQQIAKAQQRRREAGKSPKVSKAEKKAQTEAHEQEQECGIASCETCNQREPEEILICLAHHLAVAECQECDGEGAIFLEAEDVTALRSQYDAYVEQQTMINREALQAAQEAALFLLLIKKPVQLTIAPAQQAFADLLRLTAPTA